MNTRQRIQEFRRPLCRWRLLTAFTDSNEFLIERLIGLNDLPGLGIFGKEDILLTTEFGTVSFHFQPEPINFRQGLITSLACETISIKGLLGER